ncbi:hypothetical protein BIY24_01335 [Halobacteriovorax marinus]|uniref:Exported protein n=1 Tax=Halobacteriovorax marinus (strain ATCC BAA-682 / DSM 15412 / SJ) TaxID=862908 RepID=E1X3A0_HALMS|nr:hypothetical protein [Halobacteriovorax marinus]ATH06624.1 hypothetical protein BIY24_01335 [Halobacteriovorax marinus]CBW25195.1 putative exported protein [Halobacteriovorax marinus SJ]
MKILAPLFILLMAFTSVKAQESNKKVVYRYKKYEKFDFEDLVIEGETGNPGDLSIAPRYQRKFKNKLPYRKNFNAEIRKGVERVR